MQSAVTHTNEIAIRVPRRRLNLAVPYGISTTFVFTREKSHFSGFYRLNFFICCLIPGLKALFCRGSKRKSNLKSNRKSNCKSNQIGKALPKGCEKEELLCPRARALFCVPGIPTAVVKPLTPALRFSRVEIRNALSFRTLPLLEEAGARYIDLLLAKRSTLPVCVVLYFRAVA